MTSPINRKTELRQQIIAAVTELPGITKKDLKELLDQDDGTMRNMLHRMVQEGLLTAVPIPRETKGRKANAYHPGPGNPKERTQTMREQIKQQPFVPVQEPAPNITRELHELRKWKAWAIQAYPELNISAQVLEARKLLAAQYSNGEAHEILTGKRDQSPAIKALVFALT